MTYSLNTCIKVGSYGAYRIELLMSIRISCFKITLFLRIKTNMFSVTIKIGLA